MSQPNGTTDAIAAKVAGSVAAAISTFGAAVKPRLRGPGEPEDQMRGPLEALLQMVGASLGVALVPHGESSLSDLRVRPDYAIEINGAVVGYLEVKAPGKGANPLLWPKTSHDRQQFEKLSRLPNVLYTDGQEWGLYRAGERVDQIARLHGDIRHAGSQLAPVDTTLARILTAFLTWEPVPPRTLRQVVDSVAGLCRLLRDEVAETLAREATAPPGSPTPFTALAGDWRELLFPAATDAEFADGYAQTVTFALLLARVDGIDFTGRRVDEIARLLGKQHSLMGRALDVLTDDTLGQMALTVDTLVRVVGVVDWSRFESTKRDPYLYLYEHFLEVYDPELRKASGSYYTPPDVVAAMTRLTEEVLRSRLGYPLGYASDGVVVVDPAMGTGAYLLDIIERAADTIEDEEGTGAVPARLRQMAKRIIGFERQTGPYAVAELRGSEAFRRHHATLPADGLRLYVADTLDNPYVEQDKHIFAALEPIARSRRAANSVKRDEPVLVVIGNPPYKDRAARIGGWIEAGNPAIGQRAPLNDFRAEGQGRYEYVLSNLAIYFWRWAAWKVFDAHPEAPAGVIAYISTAGYLTGPGFAGMREHLRRQADEGWVIDLTPEGQRPPVNTRIFPGVAQPLAIGIFVRYGQPNPDSPAEVHYTALEGLQHVKFERLSNLSIHDPEWVDCATGWQDPFTPAGAAMWTALPAVADLLPWQPLGCKPNRGWVYSPDPQTLQSRWKALVAAKPRERKTLLKETTDRHVTSKVSPLPGGHVFNGTIADEPSNAAAPELRKVGYRSFDVQWILPDNRLTDRPRPELWAAAGPAQVFATEQHSQPLTGGPGLTFTAHLPDTHHYNGRGGRVLPLYRDDKAAAPNNAPGLLDYLRTRLGATVSPEDLMAYIAAVVAHDGYTQRYRADLETPGVRVPLTGNPELWHRAVQVGGEVLWLHTRGERYADSAQGRPAGPPRLPADRRPKVTAPIPDTPDEMPEQPAYDPDTRTLVVGLGRISPVSPEVWTYEVSGMRVVRKWFGYRQGRATNRRSSPLDDIRPDHWLPDYTTDLLDLLQVLQRVVDLEPVQADLLAEIVDGPLITVADLTAAGVFPVPPLARKPGRPDGAQDALI